MEDEARRGGDGPQVETERGIKETGSKEVDREVEMTARIKRRWEKE